MTSTDSKTVRADRLPWLLALAAALFAASLVIVPPASAEDVTIWSAELEVKTLNAAQDELGCSDSGPFNGQCGNSNVLSDDDFSLHGNPYTITRIEDDGSELELTLDTALPSNVLEFLTLHVGDDTELAFEDARVSSNSRRYTWSSSPSWSLGDDVDLSITDSSGPSLVKNTSLDDNERNLFENGHRSAQAFTAGTWARVTLIGIGIGDEVDDDVDVTLHKGGGSNPGDRLKRLSNPSSITADSVNVFTVPDGGIVLEASKTYFVQVKTTSSDRVAVSVTGPLSGGNAEDDGAAENWTIDNDSWTNRPSIGTWQASNQSMRIDVKGQVLLAPPENVTARAVAPMRVTLDWDRTLPSPKIIDRDDGYKIQWSPDGSTSWTSLVNYTNQYVTDSDIWCTCYPTRFNDNTITPGTTRHYRVKAVDDDDESPWSDVVMATTPGLVDSDQGRFAFEYGAVVSELDALNDQKVFRIDLQASEKYRFMIQGKATRHRVIVTGPDGTETWNDVLEVNNTLIPRFTTQAAGIHQVKISHGGSPGQYTSLNAGWFHFVLVPEREHSLSELTFGPDEQPDGVVLNTYGDVDRFGLRVQPGKAYRVRVVGRENDPFFTAATPRIVRARPPSTTHVYNMGKPWVDGVTTAASSTICHGFSEPEKCEYQAFVIDLRGQTGAQQTWHIIVAPTARSGTYPYRVGTYSVLLDELSASQLEGVRMPLRAWFASQPAQHDGSKAIKVRVAFSDAVEESPENVGEHGVAVEGGEVTSVRAVGGSASAGAGTRSAGGRNAGQEDREVVWEFEIEPDSYGDVTVALEAWRPCEETGAICTADGRVLSQGISTTVRGPVAGAQDPLTARFERMPETHDGESAFTFRVAFSEDIGISFRALREDAFTVTNGHVTRGRRVDDRRDLFVMTVQPDAEGDVTITLEAGRDCATSGAICTKGENRRRLTNSLSATVAGPAAALSVSDAEATEGDAVEFTVSLSGASGQQVTVRYATSSGTAESGTDFTPASGTLTFAAKETSKTVSVPTTGDSEEEEDETFSLRLSSPANATLGDATGTGTIIDDEAPSPEPLTAQFIGMPKRHDGAAAFTFELRFSEELALSYRTLRDAAFDVTGGTVRGARRLQRPSNLRWEITVKPASDADVRVVLPETTDCDATGAICTKGENRRRLTNSPSATVKGPGSEASEGFSLAPENSSPSGIWSDGQTAWVADLADARLYAYSLEDGQRQPEKDIVTEPSPMGLWSDGETLWVAGLGGGLRAHRLADGSRQPWRDLALEADAAPGGVWSNGETAWVSEWLGDTLHAYRLSDGRREAGRDIELADGNLMPVGLWSDGETLWVADWRDRIYAYRLSDGRRDPARDLVASMADADPTGLWSGGGTLLSTGWEDGEVRAYRLPALPAPLDGPGKGREGFGRARAASLPPIADPALAAAIGAALGKAPGESASPAELAGLETLEARNAGIRDLAGLESATNLKVLDLGFNPLADLWPLAALPALEHLNLDGAVPDLQDLAALTGLKRLSLRHNGIRDLGMLAGLTQLEELDAGDNRIGDLWPLAGLRQLQVLRMDRNRIADLWPLASLARLEALELGANRIGGLEPLAGLSRLRTLRLAGNDLRELYPLSGLEGLRDLGLAGNPVRDLRGLSGLGGLRRLDLRGNAVGDLRPLQALGSLDWVHVGGTRIEDLAPLDNLPGLTVAGRDDLQPPEALGGTAGQAGRD